MKKEMVRVSAFDSERNEGLMREIGRFPLEVERRSMKVPVRFGASTQMLVESKVTLVTFVSETFLVHERKGEELHINVPFAVGQEFYSRLND